MRRAELDHLPRAAGALTGQTEIIVLGSQAILAAYADTELPQIAVRSIEADLAVPTDIDGTIADEIDGLIGEGSQFHETNGVYADGTELSTARLPTGWRDRVLRYSNANTGGVTGLCLEPHDLCAAKLLANRPKDLEFCRALLGAHLIDSGLLRARIALTDAEDDEREWISQFLEQWPSRT